MRGPLPVGRVEGPKLQVSNQKLVLSVYGYCNNSRGQTVRLKSGSGAYRANKSGCLQCVGKRQTGKQ